MGIDKNIFYIPALCFLIILIYYVLALYPMTEVFSFENDLGSHIARLNFFEKYGYSGPAPEWYEGYKPFELYPPGIFFFLYVLNLFMQDSLAVWYAGLVLILLMGIGSFLLFGKIVKIASFKAMTYFLFFFASPLMMLNIVRLGRYPEVFGWLIFILFCCGVYYFREKRINWMFIPFILIYSFLMLAYMYIFVVASILILSLFLIKKGRERLFVFLGGLISFALTFFWWKDFLYFRFGEVYQYGAGLELLELSSIVSFNTIIMAAFFILFVFYIKSLKTKKDEFIFYLPLLLMAMLLASRLLIFIPILNNIPINTYSIFYLFVLIFFLMKSEFGRWSKLVSLALLFISIGSMVFLLITVQPHLRYSEKDKGYIDVLANVEGKFLFISLSDESYAEKMLAYGYVFYDVHTPSGFYLWILESKPDLKKRIKYAYTSYKEHSCEKLKHSLESLYLKEFFVEQDGCSFIKECGFELKKEFKVGCLFYSRIQE